MSDYRWLSSVLGLILVSSPWLAAPPSELAEKTESLPVVGPDSPPRGAERRLGSKRLRHNDSIFTAAFSPDARNLISASTDGTVRVWEISTGKELARWSQWALSSTLTALAVSPDGKQIAIGTKAAVWLWDWGTGERPKLFAQSERMPAKNAALPLWLGVTSLAYSPDANRLAWTNAQGTIFVRELRTKNPILTIETRPGLGLGSVEYYIAFSPDSKLVAYLGGGDKIRLWSLAPIQELAPLQTGGGEIKGIAFSPDSRLLAVGSSKGTISVWDLKEGKVRDQFQAVIRGFREMVFAPDSKVLVWLNGVGTISFWSLEKGKTIKEIHGPHTGVLQLAISPDGKQVAVVGESEAIRLWDVDTGKEITFGAGHLCRIPSVAISPDNRLVATGSHDWSIALWEMNTGKLRRKLTGHRAKVQAVTFSPDGKQIASAGNDRTVRFWDTISGNQVQVFQTSDRVYDLAFGPEGKTLICYEGAHGIHLYRLPGMQEVGNIGLPRGGFHLATSPDRKDLAMTFGNEVVVWDLTRGQVKFTINKDGETGEGVSYSPDGKKLVVAYRNPTGVHIYELTDRGARLEKRLALSEVPLSVCFVGGGKLVACGTQKGSVTLWDVGSGKKRFEGQTDAGEILSMTATSDGSRFVTGNADTTALIWDVAAMQRKDKAAVLRDSAERDWTLSQLRMSAALNGLPPGIWLWNSLPLYCSPTFSKDIDTGRR